MITKSQAQEVFLVCRMSPDTLNNLSPYTLNNLSPYTLNNLNDFKNSIPELNVDKPYSQMLEAIEKNEICYKQSQWGSLSFSQSDKHYCETPMCIAGHLVHMAGRAGYDFKDKYDYNRAAQMIHDKKYPDVPCFNFLITTDETGLRYIKMVAAFENREDKSQSFNDWANSLPE